MLNKLTSRIKKIGNKCLPDIVMIGVKVSILGGIAMGIMLSLGGRGDGMEEPKPVLEPDIIVAKYADIPVEIDGVLDDEAWKGAIVYRMFLGEDRGEKPQEEGEAMVSWDSDYLYVGIKFYDSDIVAEGEEDQLHHYRLGDLAEVFLKPEDRTWYWEYYVTPRGKKTTFWYPGRGRLGLPSGFQLPDGCELRVAARHEGTLNHWQDRDNYWTAEMAVPVRNLTARGEEFGPDSKWRILVARYNFSRYLPWKELSMTPQLSITSFHLHEEYAILKLVPSARDKEE